MTETLSAVHRYATIARSCTEARNENIVAARIEGETFRVIAEAAGLSPHAIEKIVRKRTT